MIDELKKIYSLYSTGAYAAATLYLLFLIIANPYTKFFWDAIRVDNHKKNEMMVNLLISDKLSIKSNIYLREYFERELFKKLYGVFADAELRTALLKFMKAHSSTIHGIDLKFAYKFIRPSDNEIGFEIEFRAFEIMNYLLLVLIQILIIFAYFVALIVAIQEFNYYLDNPTTYSFSYIPILSTTIQFGVISYFIYRSLLPYNRMRRVFNISKSLNRVQKHQN